jgi:hypothetical protein
MCPALVQLIKIFFSRSRDVCRCHMGEQNNGRSKVVLVDVKYNFLAWYSSEYVVEHVFLWVFKRVLMIILPETYKTHFLLLL